MHFYYLRITSHLSSGDHSVYVVLTAYSAYYDWCQVRQECRRCGEEWWITRCFNYSATIVTSRRIIFIGKGVRKEEKNINFNKIPLLRYLINNFLIETEHTIFAMRRNRTGLLSDQSLVSHNNINSLSNTSISHEISMLQMLHGQVSP